MKWPWGIVFWSFHFISAGAQVFHSSVKSAYLTGGAYRAHFTDAFSFTVNPAVLPYIKVGKEESLYSAVRERWKGGDADILIRAGQVLEKSVGYEKPVRAGASYYTGSPQKIFFRYSYNYKELLQYGLTAEKDAGEPFLRVPSVMDLIFTHFIFFCGIPEWSGGLPWEILL